MRGFTICRACRGSQLVRRFIFSSTHAIERKQISEKKRHYGRLRYKQNLRKLHPADKTNRQKSETPQVSFPPETPPAPSTYQDVLKPEAAWTAMMLVMGQESDADRLNILRLILRDTYVTTAAGQKLIDQLSHMGIYPRDVVEMWDATVVRFT